MAQQLCTDEKKNVGKMQIVAEKNHSTKAAGICNLSGLKFVFKTKVHPLIDR